ncbi:EAL domain-containing protein/glycosyl transferase [Halomicronema hongdechloris C2206]|uniref:EAL domain-containing protein/glycosyl transferase n=1 Tax=Halomicronema hongdechloris C2206 TaxID=1641165 RepID=A0A1Z3HMQ1_9CYAN|nr:glycosyltransferase [Halomicronema hongdechloris]ASC71570.1 EAL domain-containing protein/glycosyl transferase [Halomicronema hongdechloris C2206]
MFISVVICTLNRADYLRKAIKSLTSQTFNAAQFEIIVVDNNSTDNTRSVAKDEFGGINNIRYLFEPVMGLSQARNTGWQNSRGDFIAFLDDDAIAAPQWLEIIAQVFASVTPMPGCVGGKVKPLWESPRPSWLSDSLLSCLSLIDYADYPTFLEDGFVVGANMAFPKKVLQELDGFSTMLGRKGKSLLSNEEILLRNQLKSAGYKIFYHPEASVIHQIPASRLEQSWFLKRYYFQGVSDAYMMLYKNNLSSLRRLNLVRRKTKSLLNLSDKLVPLFLRSEDANTFYKKCQARRDIGYIAALAGLSKT